MKGGLYIKGTGGALPRRIVKNSEFETWLDTSDEWIRTRTGICERRFCSDGESAFTLAVEAGKEALLRAGVLPEEISLVIVATATPDHAMPSTACLVQEALGIRSGIPAFDINAACTGFVYALATADALMRQADGGYALIIGTEQMSRILDMKDRSTAVLFGDGAGAVVAGYSDAASFTGHMAAEGNKEALSASPLLKMNGRAVFRFAVSHLEEEILTLARMADIPLRQADYIVCHQANRRIIDHVRVRLGLDEQIFPVNLDSLGNTSGASIPLVLHELEERGCLKEGTRLFLLGFGAGLTWGSVSISYRGQDRPHI